LAHGDLEGAVAIAPKYVNATGDQSTAIFWIALRSARRHGDVENAVVVEIPYRQSTGSFAGAEAEGNGALECAVAPVEEDAHHSSSAKSHQVGRTVAVEICHDQRGGVIAWNDVGDGILKGAVAVAQQHGHSRTGNEHQIQAAVVTQIRHDQLVR